MTASSGIENIRILVSAHLTKILMLYGRLDLDYNARYLPVTVSSLNSLINELEVIEKQNAELTAILKENIDRRINFSNVFLVPEVLRDNPTVSGLRAGLAELAAPIVAEYCEQDRMFLANLDPVISERTRATLFNRTKRNCELLYFCCREEDRERLKDLREWCELELEGRKTTEN
jgi:hypothetical protein